MGEGTASTEGGASVKLRYTEILARIFQISLLKSPWKIDFCLIFY